MTEEDDGYKTDSDEDTIYEIALRSQPYWYCSPIFAQLPVQDAQYMSQKILQNTTCFGSSSCASGEYFQGYNWFQQNEDAFSWSMSNIDVSEYADSENPLVTPGTCAGSSCSLCSTPASLCDVSPTASELDDTEENDGKMETRVLRLQCSEEMRAAEPNTGGHAQVEQHVEQVLSPRTLAFMQRIMEEGQDCKYLKEQTNQWSNAVFSFDEGAKQFYLLTEEVACPVKNVISFKTDTADLPENIANMINPGDSDRFVLLTYKKSGDHSRCSLLMESATLRIDFVRCMKEILSTRALIEARQKLVAIASHLAGVALDHIQVACRQLLTEPIYALKCVRLARKDACSSVILRELSEVRILICDSIVMCQCECESAFSDVTEPDIRAQLCHSLRKISGHSFQRIARRSRKKRVRNNKVAKPLVGQ